MGYCRQDSARAASWTAIVVDGAIIRSVEFNDSECVSVRQTLCLHRSVDWFNRVGVALRVASVKRPRVGCNGRKCIGQNRVAGYDAAKTAAVAVA